MGIKFGEIDANQILENEFRIGVLEHILDKVLSENSSVQLSEEDIEEIRSKVAKQLSKKYPSSGIEYKK